MKEDIELAKKLLDEAGWKVGADGIREKDGIKLAPKVYYTQVANFGRVSEAIQGYLRKIGVDWRLQPFDSTIAPAKMGEQDYEIWTVAVPYLSAGELMNLYFDSKNIPTPNRMNWKDPETDEWLRLGRAALIEADRAKNYMQVQKKVTDEHLWIPVVNVNMYLVSHQEAEGRPAAHALPEHFLQGPGLVALRKSARENTRNAWCFCRWSSLGWGSRSVIGG